MEADLNSINEEISCLFLWKFSRLFTNECGNGNFYETPLLAMSESELISKGGSTLTWADELRDEWVSERDTLIEESE